MTEPGPVTTPDQAEHVRNVLFIMCDQLRLDALSCYGGIVDTPHIDALASRGVRFDRAHVQGAVCGSSRMSFYTGRYPQTHGARWNRIPLSINQRTLGDHLRPLGVRTVLVGKTHMIPDVEGMNRLGLTPDSPENMYLSECGFEAIERDDGLHSDRAPTFDLPYNQFLRQNGFDGDNPWHTAANSVLDESGAVVSGWLLRSSTNAAIVPDELSETAYMTNRAIDFMRECGDERWCMHLSFIKPHWPYVVSEPYHRLVDPLDLPAPHRSQDERSLDHPVLQAFWSARIGSTFARDEVRNAVYPAYLGLVKQIDDHLGRLLSEMESMGRLDDTMIVLTSDHGDYMGDHFLGDKDWFHNEIVNIPMIVVDPRASADPTRGTSSNDLVEAIDLLPTFVEAVGGQLADTEPWLEGDSLIPVLHGDPAVGAQRVVCETDYGFLEMANHLPPTDRVRERRATMLRNDRYKYILSETGPNLLYDLEDDPDEFVDRSSDPGRATIVADLHDQLFEWFRTRNHDPTYADATMSGMAQPGRTATSGIMIGYWDEADLEAGLAGELF